MKNKAVVLLSGGLDSAVALYHAMDKGHDCHCLTFDYGQRHGKEVSLARAIARAAGAKLTIMKLDLPWKGSSLLDKKQSLPSGRSAGKIRSGGIPTTYVPARNTLFLSAAASFAEALGASSIFIGAHYEDSSGYPDCRKEYLEAFDKVVRLGTKAGGENRLSVKYPLIGLTKSGIIEEGRRLGVPFEITWSCYKGGRKPCGKCDSCVLRAKGFRRAGIKDPAIKG